MLKIIITLMALISTGCTTVEYQKTTLRDQFLVLTSAIKKSEVISDRQKYFTESYLVDVNLQDKKSLYVLTLPNYIAKTDSYFQKNDNATGCLTINGFESNGEPLVFYVEFKNINNTWLVNYIHLEYLENKKGFVNTVICPNKVKGR